MFISVILILILTVIVIIIIIIIRSTGVYEAWLEVPPHVVMFIRSPGKTHLIHFFCHQPQPGNFFQSIRFDSLSKLLFFIGDMPRKNDNICLQFLAKCFSPTPPDLTHLLFPRHCKPSPAPGPSCLLPSCQVSSYRDSVTPNTTKYAPANLHSAQALH